MQKERQRRGEGGLGNQRDHKGGSLSFGGTLANLEQVKEHYYKAVKVEGGFRKLPSHCESLWRCVLCFSAADFPSFHCMVL